ncbi:hypothetical protein ACFFX1_15875 [Dactylosporangium sucinum]|uniref:Uncharacterized protein n=1 Tax=Dactylosporangium sucinum TaxID=1424081 RepID=A0A917TUG0_9ACTN|nr:hypothetical protein [Dactylosporangium sucinum]GGM37977.1 hypothetical protein GCM10007977_044350 [Dactylosporangium sucinum]
MDGHWEWSDGDDADTADLGGDGGGPADFGADYGHFGDAGFDHGDLGHDLGGEHHDLGHDLGHDLEEPLGTEHAAADYDHAVETAVETAGTDDAGDPGDAGEPEQLHVEDVDSVETVEAAEDPVFGVDPDVDAGADDPAWHDVPFPAELHLEDPPEPVDGFPWTDVDVIGGPQEAEFDPAVGPGEPAQAADLADYDGSGVPDGGDPWSLLLGSEDPATSSLATFWAPQG